MMLDLILKGFAVGIAMFFIIVGIGFGLMFVMWISYNAKIRGIKL